MRSHNQFIGFPGVMELTDKEVSIVRILRDLAPRLVAHVDLMRTVWPARHPDCTGNVVEVTIGRLRRKLRPTSFKIAGDKRIGWRLEQVVR